MDEPRLRSDSNSTSD